MSCMMLWSAPLCKKSLDAISGRYLCLWGCMEYRDSHVRIGSERVNLDTLDSRLSPTSTANHPTPLRRWALTPVNVDYAPPPSPVAATTTAPIAKREQHASNRRPPQRPPGHGDSSKTLP